MKIISVLVVDDETEFREAVIRRLDRRGIAVQGAASGRDALDLLARQPMDVVLLDLKMPDIDGMQTLRRIKELYPKTVVILFTGHASLESAQEGLGLGAADYLLKPSTADEIMVKIQECLRQTPAA